jgi:hypothetical protein
MDTRIFVSYASEDRSVAESLVGFLSAAGFTMWFDKESLLGGEHWEAIIEQEIARARRVIICLSKRYVEKTGFVQKELRLAVAQAELRPDSELYLIPVRLDDCAVPRALHRWHVLDLREPGATSRLLEAVAKGAGEAVGAPQSEHDALASAIRTYDHPPGTSSRHGQAAAAGELPKTQFAFTDPIPDLTMPSAAPRAAHGTHRLELNTRAWLFLRDIYGGYYLQNPPVDLLANGQWVAGNLRIGTEIDALIAVQVDEEGRRRILDWVGANRWGRIGADEVKALSGYKELGRVRAGDPKSPRPGEAQPERRLPPTPMPSHGEAPHGERPNRWLRIASVVVASSAACLTLIWMRHAPPRQETTALPKTAPVVPPTIQRSDHITLPEDGKSARYLAGGGQGGLVQVEGECKELKPGEVILLVMHAADGKPYPQMNAIQGIIPDQNGRWTAEVQVGNGDHPPDAGQQFTVRMHVLTKKDYLRLKKDNEELGGHPLWPPLWLSAPPTERARTTFTLE